MAGQSLDTITQAVETINGMSTEIAAASEQQSIVAENINQNVVNISQSGKEVLDGSQQSVLSSERLAKLAAELQILMSQFKLTDDNYHASRSRPYTCEKITYTRSVKFYAMLGVGRKISIIAR
jgi:hypothetical protein